MVMCSCSKWMNPNDLSDPFDLAQPKRPQPSLGASPSSINEFHKLKMAYVIIGSSLFYHNNLSEVRFDLIWLLETGNMVS